MTHERATGILLPIPSLPSDYGIGDFGPEAYRFAGWLKAAGQRYWQILPLNPTDPFYGSSPYRSASAFALNPLFASPDLLAKSGFLDNRCLYSLPRLPNTRVDYPRVGWYKRQLLYSAWQRLRRRRKPGPYRRFCQEHAFWLDDYALYSAVKHRSGGLAWTDWPVRLRQRDPATLNAAAGALADDLERVRFEQYLALGQWLALKRYCNRQGISIIGDLPIYVDSDSADVWANQKLFQLDRRGQPRFVAGVPPDYFSEAGQLWGNPVYDWREHVRTGFRWWLARIGHYLKLVDVIRVDHFRGLAGFWQVRAGATTAVKGRWVKAPGHLLLSALKDRITNLTSDIRHLPSPSLPIIAEDLGVITLDVTALRRRFNLPGTRVLLFAFGEDTARSPHRPENLEPDCVLYTGTHDNNTVRGWYERDATDTERRNLEHYLGRRPSASAISRELVRIALQSRARTVILPIQDVLGLGQTARLNRPGQKSGNWQWRLSKRHLTPARARELRALTTAAGRVCGARPSTLGTPAS